MRAPVLFALLAPLLAACTPMHWVKADASAEQLRGDEQECQQAAWREANARYYFYQPMGPVFSPGTGMMLPSGSVVDPYGYQMLEESRLTQFCMEAKGYRLEPLPKP